MFSTWPMNKTLLSFCVTKRMRKVQVQGDWGRESFHLIHYCLTQKDQISFGLTTKKLNFNFREGFIFERDGFSYNEYNLVSEFYLFKNELVFYQQLLAEKGPFDIASTSIS